MFLVLFEDSLVKVINFQQYLANFLSCFISDHIALVIFLGNVHSLETPTQVWTCDLLDTFVGLLSVVLSN